MKSNPQSARWAALVGDRLVPMPRRHVTVQLIKDQAGITDEFMLARDYETTDDIVLSNDAEIDLAEGNVFKKVQNCGPAGPPHKPSSSPKLAFFVDDAFEITLNPIQTEDTLRRLFGLKRKVQLLRDLESPNDTPIADGEKVNFVDGPVFISTVDIEKHCDNTPPPTACSYIIRVDKTRYIVKVPKLTGKEILALAGKLPNEWLLNQKINKQFVPIEPDQVIDLTACGIERFTTLPNEQSEGRPSPRHQFLLPEEDTDALTSAGLSWETIVDQGSHWLIIHDLKLPEAFIQRPTAVAIQIPSQYPPAALDMAYFHPPITRLDGRTIAATESSANIEGAAWQRWSRHYTSGNPWKPGEFNTFTHYLLTQSWLKRAALK